MPPTRPQTPRRPYRVVLVEINEDGSVGGSYQALHDLVSRLDRRMYTPIVVYSTENPFAARLRATGIEVHVIAAARARERAAWASGRRLRIAAGKARAIAWRRRLLLDLDADLVHLINSPRVACDDWLPACRLAGVPCVANEMMLDSMVETGPVRRWLVRRFHRILPCSEHQSAMLRAMGVPAHRVRLVPLGVDAAALGAAVVTPRAAVRAALGVGDDEVLLVMAGNLRRWKGQHVLVAALALLPDDVRRRLRVALAGSGDAEDPSYEADLRDRVAAAGLTERVAFLGFRRDVPDLFAAADLAVHASVGPEPFGLVVLEAMALGAAVIASAIGGPRDILTPETGWLFDPARPSELAQAIRTLVHDGARRARLADAGRRRVADFSLDHYVARTVAVYEELLSV